MTPDDTNQTFLRRYVDDYCKALDENYKQDTVRSLEHNLQRDPECTYSAEQLVKIMQGKAKLDKFRYYEGKKYIKVVREEYDEREDRWRDYCTRIYRYCKGHSWKCLQTCILESTCNKTR